jgi:L-cysteine S-thiosulfotransferase
MAVFRAFFTSCELRRNMVWRRLNVLFLGAVTLLASIPGSALALECKRKTTGYFQQMQAAAQVAMVPRQIPGLAKSLTGAPGDPARGRAIVEDPQKGNCLMCHHISSLGDEAAQGSIGPNISDVSVRLDEPQLRQRIVEPRVVTPSTIMPAFHSTERFARVPAQLAGAPILTPAEVEDVVAFLKTLK